MRRGSFRSADEGEITEFIELVYADNNAHGPRVTPAGTTARYDAWAYDVAAIGSDHIRTTVDYGGGTEEGFRDHVFLSLRSGAMQMSSADGAAATAGSGDVFMYPLLTPVHYDTRHVDVRTVRLTAQRMQQVAEQATGVPGTRFRFCGVTPVSAPTKRYWRSLTTLVSGALAEPDSPMSSPLLAEQMASTVATAALRTFPNTTMTHQYESGPGATAPATVRRAAAHIEAHAHLPLQLAEVAEAAGTSARALQYGFRRHLGTTPLGYLRRVRLERAHRDLQRADPTRGDTVAAIATRWGFAHPGRFATEYRAAYGTSPSQTLRQ